MKIAAILATVAALLASAPAIVACGGSDPEPSSTTETTTAPTDDASGEVPGGADPADAELIDGWSSALSRGDVEGAARYFAIPSVAENGPGRIEIRSRGDARLFNASLPCGATLVRAAEQGGFVVATFELTERPGAGSCGSGTGASAQTAFRIEDGEFVEWRRVEAGGAEAPSNTV